MLSARFESTTTSSTWPDSARTLIFSMSMAASLTRRYTAAHPPPRGGAMITVYHLTISRSERIVWLMEELGLEYRMEVHPRERSGAAPDAMRAIHALGKSPIIRDGD